MTLMHNMIWIPTQSVSNINSVTANNSLDWFNLITLCVDSEYNTIKMCLFFLITFNSDPKHTDQMKYSFFCHGTVDLAWTISRKVWIWKTNQLNAAVKTKPKNQIKSRFSQQFCGAHLINIIILKLPKSCRSGEAHEVSLVVARQTIQTPSQIYFVRQVTPRLKSSSSMWVNVLHRHLIIISFLLWIDHSLP